MSKESNSSLSAPFNLHRETSTNFPHQERAYDLLFTAIRNQMFVDGLTLINPEDKLTLVITQLYRQFEFENASYLEPDDNFIASLPTIVISDQQFPILKLDGHLHHFDYWRKDRSLILSLPHRPVKVPVKLMGNESFSIKKPDQKLTPPLSYEHYIAGIGGPTRLFSQFLIINLVNPSNLEITSAHTNFDIRYAFMRKRTMLHFSGDSSSLSSNNRHRNQNKGNDGHSGPNVMSW